MHSAHRERPLWQEAAGLHLAQASPCTGVQALWYWLPSPLGEARADWRLGAAPRARAKDGEPLKGGVQRVGHQDGLKDVTYRCIISLDYGN